jgi:hypothetical protein
METKAIRIAAAVTLAVLPALPSSAKARPDQERRPQTTTRTVSSQVQDPSKDLEGDRPADPRTVWEGGLDRLVGKYVFAQVASPGGFWLRTPDGKGNYKYRQVSFTELPRELQTQLTRSEITISDLKEPIERHAKVRESPSKRGTLRYYTESASGRLVLKGLPGVGNLPAGKSEFAGEVTFLLEHSSHSNPSITGVLFQRNNQERTWGTATLDFADFQAFIPEKMGTSGGKDATDKKGPAPKPSAPAPQRGRGEAQDGNGKPASGEQEDVPIVTNARTLRSALEIFVFIEFTEKVKGEERYYTGSVRLAKPGAPGFFPSPAQNNGAPTPAPVRGPASTGG